MYIDLSTLSDYSNSLTSEKNNIDCKLSSIIQNYGITNIDNLFSRMCSKIKHDSENYITRYNNIVNNLNKYVSDVGTIEQALMQNNGVVHTNEESVNIFFNNNMAPLRTMVDLQNGKNINYGKLGKYTYGSIGFHSLTSNINIQKKQNEEEIETSPEVSKEELQEMRNILGNVSENVDDETLSYVYASYQLIKANEEAIKKAGYTLKECLESDIAQAQRGFEISEIIKKRQHFIKTLDYGILETWMDITGTTGAQVATLTLGLTEGIVNFGENVYDAAVMGTTMALSGCLSVLGANELAGDLLKNNAEFIGYDASTNMFNYIYDETNFGDTIKEYNSNYQVMRQVSKQIGEVITTIGVGTFCPLVTIPATAAISGFGSGMEEAYSNGASVEQGLLCGAINGGINFIAFKVGQAINNSALFKTVTTEAGKEIVTISSKQAVANAVSHIFMDTADGFAESFLSPLVQMTYQNTYIDENGIEQEYSSNFWEKYSQIYENLGGLESSLSQALMGGTMSAVSEISGIAKALRNKDNIEVKNVTDIKEKVSVPQKVKNKLDNLVDNYKKELFLAKNIDEMAELTEDNITKLLGKKVSNSKAILGVICSPFSYITKTISSKLEGKELLHAIDNGIYHFSRIENCEKILESGYVKGSKPGLISYGKSKSYFFNGVPSIEKYAMNIQNIHYKTTAVKLSLDADTLSNFRYRSLNDGALTFNGDFNFNKENAKIVYFILENTENGLAYKEVTKEVWESTKNVFDNKTISDSLKKSVIKTESVSIAMSDEFDMLCNNLKKLKNSVLDKGKTFSGNVIAVKEKTKNVIERLKKFSLTDNGHVDIDAFNLKEKIKEKLNKIVLEKNKKFSGKLESSISNENHGTANRNLIEVSPMHIKNLESTARHTDWYLSSLDEEKSILFYADSLDEVPKGFFEKFKNPTNKYIKVDGKIYGFNSIDNLNVLKDAAGNDIFIFNSLDEIPEEIFMLANSNSALMINGYTYQLSQYSSISEFKKNIGHINNYGTRVKNEILQTINDNMTPIEKSRKLYLELNSRFNYSADYLQGDIFFKDKIYNKYISFSDVENSEIICKSWSELYRELLLEAGFSEEQVKIIGTNKTNSHRWVEIQLDDNKIVIADATEKIAGDLDLSTCKSGSQTSGYVITDVSNSGKRISSNFELIKDINNDQVLRKIDKSIGYTFNGQYENELIQKVNKKFGLFPTSSSTKIKKFLDIKPTNNMDGLDAYYYYSKLIDILSLNGTDIDIFKSKIKDHFEFVTFINCEDGYGKIIYSKSLGYNYFNSYDDYSSFIKKNNLILC